ncbi:MAG: 4Fe-4S dicluster domain-containing protein [Acidobacteriota bacterium]
MAAQENHRKLPSGAMSRRDFLGRSGSAVAGGMVIALVLPEGSSAGTLGADYDWNRHRWVYLIDTSKCIGCGSCVRACRAENSVPEKMYRTWVERYEIPMEGEAYVDSPDGSEHGFDPVANGLSVGKGFFVPKLCNHCRATPCIQVCPVGASFATRDGVVLTACVEICPVGARRVGDRENPDDPVIGILATRRVEVLQPELLTRPQCFYLGLDMEVR